MSLGKRKLKMSCSLSWTKSIRLLIMGKTKFIIFSIETFLENWVKRTRQDMTSIDLIKQGYKSIEEYIR